MAKVVMSWSECVVRIGKTGDNDKMATDLKAVGPVKDRSTFMETADGEELVAKATGGKVVAREQLEGEITVTTRIIEPDLEFLSELLDADLNSDKDELVVKSHIINDYYSVEISPKNVGAIGIRIRKSSLVYKRGSSEEEGRFGDLTFTVVECEDKELYREFIKKN